MLPPGVTSGETLVNFINNVSSSVKTVLSKPGSFKRNTNHRRFLQKQLRQSVQQNNDVTTSTPVSNAVENIIKTEKSNVKPSICLQDITTENAAPINGNKCCGKNLKQKTIKKKRRFHPIKTPTLSSSLPALLPAPNQSPVVIPSPTIDISERSDFEYDNFSSVEPQLQSLQNNYVKDCRSPSPEYEFYMDNYNITAVQNFYRSLNSCNPAYSINTNSSAGEFSDFLSGEDLMNTLEFGDLFIPDYEKQNELIQRSYIENERQLKYLTQLEALESRYLVQELNQLTKLSHI